MNVTGANDSNSERNAGAANKAALCPEPGAYLLLLLQGNYSRGSRDD